MRGGRRGGAVAGLAGVALALAGLAPAPAQTESTSPEVAELARRAEADPAAAARLESIERVDGRPVDMSRALRGTAQERAARLRALSGDAASPDPASGPAVSAGEARGEAQDILAGRRYRPSDPPRPLRGVLEWIGAAVDAALAPVARVLAGVLDHTAGRVVLAVLVVLAAGAVAVVLIRRRARAQRDRRQGATPQPAARPEELERQADDAEGRGDLGLAYRLRFRAGLLRLDREGRIRYRPSLTTAQLRRTVASPVFDDVATVFDAVAYGGRQPEPSQLDEARAAWGRILAGAGR